MWNRIVMASAAVGLSAGLGLMSASGQMQPPPVPAVHRHIYPEIVEGSGDVRSAIAEAHRDHKRVLIVFGGDWCGDCQVLDINLHDAENQDLLGKYFVLVHVNIGHMDENVELAQKYGVPLKRGVPAISVVSGSGKVVFAQAEGDFSKMRSMDPRSVNQFLNQWKQ